MICKGKIPRNKIGLEDSIIVIITWLDWLLYRYVNIK
jgi:hypothetical protein